MAGNYGLADPGSVLQNVPDYGNAVAALTPPSGQSSGGGADPGPTGIVFVDGKGYRRRKGLDANGNVIYRDLTTDERRMNAGQYSWGIAGINQQTAAITASTLSRDKDRTQAGDQFAASMAQQTRQMELNNDLLREKLGVEDRHFQQQMALDERNARRTKVLGSLTLIAQSLQRL
ncbi:MAG: hypothetical protein LW834_00295 [Cyanobium sp. 49614_E6]|nr:hypothetical protein [Cyanobium sp. 49614_E6]